MHRVQVLCLALALYGATSTPAQSCDNDSGCWPKFKFMDDLTRIGQPCPRRDPYKERIETDRHDFTQSTETVGRGVFQVESGYSYFYKDQDEEIESSHTTPELLLRYGLSDDIEVRLRWNYAWSTNASTLSRMLTNDYKLCRLHNLFRFYRQRHAPARIVSHKSPMNHASARGSVSPVSREIGSALRLEDVFVRETDPIEKHQCCLTTIDPDQCMSCIALSTVVPISLSASARSTS